MKIGITGAYGQFGWHLRCRLFAEKDVEIRCAGRAEFENADNLAQLFDGCDAVVHLAGVNRAADQEIAMQNPRLAEQLVEALGKTNTKAHILFASSTQIANDNVYGRAKKRSGEIIEKWSSINNTAYSEFVFPHLFGENGRPFYNSAVSTFCHQIANGEIPSVNTDGRVELIHFQDASELILTAIRKCNSGRERPAGVSMSVGELLKRIQSLAGSYEKLVMPNLSTPIDLRLFNAYRSYLYPDHYPVSLKTHGDARGDFTELVRSDNGGQTSFSTTKPGITRGNHYHFHKVERFIVVKGRASVKIRRMFSDVTNEFILSGEDIHFIDIPTLNTHDITNIGDEELITLFWSHDLFDPDNPDTIFEQV